jgi:hypothetical protein
MELNTSGLEEIAKDTLLRTWAFIKKRKSARLIFDQAILDNSTDQINSYLGSSFRWQLKNLFEVQNRNSFLYLAHIEIDLGLSKSHKYGFKDYGSEFRLWCICDDYQMSDIVIKEKEVTNKFASIALSIFQQKRVLVVPNKRFSSKYDVVCKDVLSAQSFLTPKLLNKIGQLSDFTLSIKSGKLFLGFNRDFNLNQCISILNLIEEI